MDKGINIQHTQPMMTERIPVISAVIARDWSLWGWYVGGSGDAYITGCWYGFCGGILLTKCALPAFLCCHFSHYSKIIMITMEKPPIFPNRKRAVGISYFASTGSRQSEYTRQRRQRHYYPRCNRWLDTRRHTNSYTIRGRRRLCVDWQCKLLINSVTPPKTLIQSRQIANVKTLTSDSRASYTGRHSPGNVPSCSMLWNNYQWN